MPINKGRGSAELLMCQILFVEDHDDTRRAFVRLLRIWGHQVFAFRSVTSGVAFLSENHVDVIVSDIGLPDRNGYDFMVDVRRKNKRVMAIAVSAFCAAADRQRSREAGFDMHFPKPVDVETLRQVLARILSRGEGVNGSPHAYDRGPLKPAA
jgi:CheY-like chemotaxis protein